MAIDSLGPLPYRLPDQLSTALDEMRDDGHRNNRVHPAHSGDAPRSSPAATRALHASLEMTTAHEAQLPWKPNAWDGTA